MARSKIGRGTAIEHKMELLKEQIDELINVDPVNTQQALNFIEYFTDTDMFTFNEFELLARPYQPIARVERIPSEMIAHSNEIAVNSEFDAVQSSKLKEMIAKLKVR